MSTISSGTISQTIGDDLSIQQDYKNASSDKTTQSRQVFTGSYTLLVTTKTDISDSGSTWTKDGDLLEAQN